MNGKEEKYEIMDDQEFEIIDELYFVVSFNSLKEELSYSETELKMLLKKLIVKDWVKCFSSPDEEVNFEENDFDKNYKDYYYLASKKGLKVHNSTD